MKVKLKSGETLSSINNYCNLKYDDWVSLNQGKTIEIDDLSKHIDALRVEKIRDGEKAGQFLVAGRKGASTHSSFQRVVTEEELPNVIGKDLAAKVVKDAPKYPDGTEYTGLDLKVGGEGMRGFYDKIIKNYAEKMLISCIFLG